MGFESGSCGLYGDEHASGFGKLVIPSWDVGVSRFVGN